MLPSGPRYTHPLPPAPAIGARSAAAHVLASIKAEIERSQELRLGTISLGCDGMSTINPLDGTLCNGDEPASACDLVLYNPQTRSVVSKTVGRTFASSLQGCQQLLRPAGVAHLAASTDCTDVMADLRARRRFVDNMGNLYGPDGEWITSDSPPAVLETDYVHEIRRMHVFDIEYDPPVYFLISRLNLRKMSGMLVTLSLENPDYAQGTIWPSVDDVISSEPFLALSGAEPFYTTNPLSVVTGLDDATIAGNYLDSVARFFTVRIDGIGDVGMGTPDTFKLQRTGLADITGINCDGPLFPPQDLGYGLTVTFGSRNGHTMDDRWIATAAPNNTVRRHGVAIRGTIATAGGCANGGHPNNNVLLTAEMTTGYVSVDTGTTFAGRELWLSYPYATGSHALVVRNPDTLALLYRKTLDHNTLASAWGDPPEKFSFSTNDEGLFFLHCYTTPFLPSPPSPYPGHEFGAPDPRKVAVISVNPLTFEPTITELITLEDRGITTYGSTFSVASTLP